VVGEELGGDADGGTGRAPGESSSARYQQCLSLDCVVDVDACCYLWLMRYCMEGLHGIQECWLLFHQHLRNAASVTRVKWVCIRCIHESISIHWKQCLS
jgi:hypothetical protein